MNNYYFVATALPPLQLGVPPDISFPDFITLLHDNLTPEDFEKTKVIRRYYDIQNIRAFWLEKSLDPRGNLNKVDLEEALLSGEGLPGYVYEFINAYDTLEKKLEYFPALLAAYYSNEISKASGFLKKFLEFEREWRLIFTAFRSKLLSRDLNTELQFENPENDFVAQILAQKDAKAFITPEGYNELQPLFEEHASDPLRLYKAISEYRFYKIEEMLNVDLFSIDRILGYMVQLIIVEKWLELDKKKGMEIIDKTVFSRTSNELGKKS